jgi:transcriptional accessory protein Tex/SPT6
MVDVLSVDAKRQRIELALSSGSTEVARSSNSSSSSSRRSHDNTELSKRMRSESTDEVFAPANKSKRK